jgi:hypothetical protein
LFKLYNLHCPGRVTFDYQVVFSKKKAERILTKKPLLDFIGDANCCSRFVCLALNPVQASTTRALSRLRHPTPSPACSTPTAATSLSSPDARSAALLAQKMDEATQFQTKALVLLLHATQGRSGYTTPRYLSATLHTILATNH